MAGLPQLPVPPTYSNPASDIATVQNTPAPAATEGAGGNNPNLYTGFNKPNTGPTLADVLQRLSVARDPRAGGFAGAPAVAAGGYNNPPVPQPAAAPPITPPAATSAPLGAPIAAAPNPYMPAGAVMGPTVASGQPTPNLITPDAVAAFQRSLITDPPHPSELGAGLPPPPGNNEIRFIDKNSPRVAPQPQAPAGPLEGLRNIDVQHLTSLLAPVKTPQEQASQQLLNFYDEERAANLRLLDAQSRGDAKASKDAANQVAYFQSPTHARHIEGLRELTNPNYAATKYLGGGLP